MCLTLRAEGSGQGLYLKLEVPYTVYYPYISDLKRNMEPISSTYETLHHTRGNQPAASAQHIRHHKSRVRHISEHQQGRLRWMDRMCSNKTVSVCLGILCVLLLAVTITQYVLHSLGKGELERILSEVDRKIQSGWWYYNSSVYYISESNQMSWTQSRQHCKARQADLVIINCFEEQMFIEKLTNIFKMDVWIGLTNRDHQEVWKWVDGCPLTNSFWSLNQRLSHGSEQCVSQFSFNTMGDDDYTAGVQSFPGRRKYIMFHGTTMANAQSIKCNGFTRSTDGMLGPGVYVSRSFEKACRYPIDGKGQKLAVLKLSVQVGKVKRIHYQGHPLQKTWHEHGYDTAWVPRDCGMVSSGLEEDCIYDPWRITVLDILPNPRN